MKWDPKHRRLQGPSCVHLLFIPISNPAASSPDAFQKINSQQLLQEKSQRGGLNKSKYHLWFWWFLQYGAGSSQNFAHQLGCWMYLYLGTFIHLLLLFKFLFRFFCNSGNKAQALLCNRSHQTAQKCPCLVFPTRGSILRLSVGIQHWILPGTWHLCRLSSI